MAATLPVTATNTCCASPFCSDMLGQRSIASVRFYADSAEKSARLHWLDWLSLDYPVASKASYCARLFCQSALVRASCCNHKFILIFNSQPPPSLNPGTWLATSLSDVWWRRDCGSKPNFEPCTPDKTAGSGRAGSVDWKQVTNAGWGELLNAQLLVGTQSHTLMQEHIRTGD